MSSKDVLSENELDALMDSVSSGDVDFADEAAGQNCQPFDFSTREQVFLAQMRGLETLNEKHSLALTQAVRDLFKVPVEIKVGDIELVRMEEAINRIPEPSGINVLKIAPLGGVSMVVYPGELLSVFVDRYFGGAADDSSVKKASRINLTPTERRINDLLLEKFQSTLVTAWHDKIALSTEKLSFESRPDFLQGGAPSEMALRFPFVTKIGDWQSAIDWIVPYASFEPLKPKLGSPPLTATAKPGNNWEAYFRGELLSIELEVHGVFTTRKVSIAEVLSLKKGSIVPLKMPSEVSVWIEGQMISTGEHGSLNGNKSIKIMEMLKQ
jgi:flagellar motor switch protein FliM